MWDINRANDNMVNILSTILCDGEESPVLGMWDPLSMHNVEYAMPITSTENKQSLWCPSVENQQ